jgi:hypothetical protein
MLGAHLSELHDVLHDIDLFQELGTAPLQDPLAFVLPAACAQAPDWESTLDPGSERGCLSNAHDVFIGVIHVVKLNVLDNSRPLGRLAHQVRRFVFLDLVELLDDHVVKRLVVDDSKERYAYEKQPFSQSSDVSDQIQHAVDLTLDDG